MTERVITIRSHATSRVESARRLKVLLLSPGVTADTGEWMIVERLAAGLRSDGWLPTTLRGGSSTAVESLVRSFFRGRVNAVRWLRQLIGKITEQHVVHIVAFSTASFWTFVIPMTVLARFFSKRIVLTFEPADLEQFLVRWLWLLRPFLRLADRIVAENLHFAAFYEKAGFRAECAPFPVDGLPVVDNRTARLQPRILFDSPLTAESNPFCLLKGFRILKQKYPRAELVFVSSGALAERLRAYAEQERIYGVEFVPTTISGAADLVNFDLYVSSSSLVHRPQSILRAFLAGLPVVLTDAEAIPELIIDRVNGLVVPVNDHVALASRMIELVEDEKLVSDVTRHAYSDAAQFRWEKLGKAWRHTYRNL